MSLIRIDSPVEQQAIDELAALDNVISIKRIPI